MGVLYKVTGVASLRKNGKNHIGFQSLINGKWYLRRITQGGTSAQNDIELYSDRGGACLSLIREVQSLKKPLRILRDLSVLQFKRSE